MVRAQDVAHRRKHNPVKEEISCYIANGTHNSSEQQRNKAHEPENIRINYTPINLKSEPTSPAHTQSKLLGHAK